MQTTNRVLIINAHQYVQGIAEGALNKTMVEAIKTFCTERGCEVAQTTIEAGYSRAEEVEKHLWADVVIVQAPVYWFAAPWIYKKYIDEVFTTGYVQQCFLRDDGRTRENPDKQYGSGGLLQGKRVMLSLTWNAPKEAFGDPNQAQFEGKTVDDVFVGTTASYRFCGMTVLPSFSCFNVQKDPQIEADLERLRAHLASVVFGE